MRAIDTFIPGLKIIEIDTFNDNRGWFSETYNINKYKELGISDVFIQDNESFSQKGVIRGLHWQIPPFTQSKLVRVINGAVLDIALDIRKGSDTYGKYVSVELTSNNRRQFYIPRGFAHGFIVLEDNTLFSYKCDNVYNPQSCRGIKFDDQSLGIKYPKLDVPIILSQKDQDNPLLQNIDPWEDK